jgi:serine O-acetyltransferase
MKHHISIHTRLVKSLLLLEFKFSFFKILRKIINEGIYHCEISPDSFTSINAIKTLQLPHPYNIIINHKAKLGYNIRIFHNTTIGIIENGDTTPPIISDDVYIGTGAIILGNITIEKGARIGAGSIILKDVPCDKTITNIWK